MVRVSGCGDTNLVIQQIRGEIDCNAPGLELLRHMAIDELISWTIHQFLHSKRDWNKSANRLASMALQREEGSIVISEKYLQGLAALNQLNELLQPGHIGSIARVAAAIRSARKRV